MQRKYDSGIKPESNTYKNNNVDTAWYTSEYTAWKEYKVVADKTPATPSTPTLSVSGNLLTMELDTYDENTKSVYFYVVKNDTKRYGEYSADVVKNHVSMTIAVDAGAEYKAKACGSNQKMIIWVLLRLESGLSIHRMCLHVLTHRAGYLIMPKHQQK